MATTMATLGRWSCIVVLLAGCTTGTSNDTSESTDVESITSASSEEETADAISTTTTSPGSSDESTSSISPLRSAGDDPPPTTTDSQSTSAWISRTSMTADSIEVQWADRDGADEYSIHRVLRSSDDQPGVEAMTDDNQIHVAQDLGKFTDEGVEPNTSYWYGLKIVSADGDLIAHGWHRADAVDDEEPPSAVPDLTATKSDAGEVLVSWSKPDENYELHSYRILRGVNGETPESIATTWQIDQTSFIDDELPGSGEVVYEVVAMDFHWNESSPSQVTVDLS